MRNIVLILLISLFTVSCVQAQLGRNRGKFINRPSSGLDYANPRQYEIGGITVAGVQFLDNTALITLSGLSVGEKIMVPGDKLSGAIRNLWKQELFDDVQINITRIDGDLIFLELVISERARLSRFSFSGIKKADADDIRERIKLVAGKVVNDNLLNNTTNRIKKYYVDKGFLNVDVNIVQQKDTTLSNSVMLKIIIDKNKKVKVNAITFEGNTVFKDKKLRKFLKETKQKTWYNVFKTSKYIEKDYTEDKQKIFEKYNEKGYRDFSILKDTVYKFNQKSVNIDVKVSEGPKYYFGNISWTGNTKYTTEALQNVLGIKKGEVFNQIELSTRINGNPNGRDVSSLYLDDGYLFFNINPVETRVYNDTIDLEMRIYEGAQATIDKVTIKGNEKTNDKVILREIRSKPGQKFSRSDISRTIRELAQLNYFDQQQLNVTPIPHPETGTVDIEYTVAEKPSDQLELSGGFGAGRIVGTLGVSFNNFSLRNLFSKDWKGYLPTGDGQKLSLRAQTNGLYYQSYSFSFSEPWLGGRKPIYLGVSIYRSTQSNGIKRGEAGRRSIDINGLSVSIGQRLKVPDDFFTLNSTVSVQQYLLNNYGGFVFDKGNSYNISLTETFARNSIDAPVYPTSGSILSFSIQATPPYSLFNKIDYTTATPEVKYKLIEYHKWKFETSWFVKIVGQLVTNVRMQYGFLGFYNKDIGVSPFERFKLGGDGLVGFDFLTGSEVIGLRGYPNNSVVPPGSNTQAGSPIFNKYVVELRHPIVNNPSATIYTLAFVEGGNTWNSFRDFNPYQIKRSVGVGVRIFLPIFGLLGLDYGYGIDDIPGITRTGSARGEFHFSINQNLGGF